MSVRRRTPAEVLHSIKTGDTGACGSYAGYQRHHKDGTVPCESCTDANRLYRNGWRVSAGGVRSLTVPVSIVRDLLQSADKRVRGEFAAELGFEVFTSVMELSADGTKDGPG